MDESPQLDAQRSQTKKLKPYDYVKFEKLQTDGY